MLNVLWGAADTPWKRRARAAARRNESMMIATARVGERLEVNVISKRHLEKKMDERKGSQVDMIRLTAFRLAEAERSTSHIVYAVLGSWIRRSFECNARNTESAMSLPCLKIRAAGPALDWLHVFLKDR